MNTYVYKCPHGHVFESTNQYEGSCQQCHRSLVGGTRREKSQTSDYESRQDDDSIISVASGATIGAAIGESLFGSNSGSSSGFESGGGGDFGGGGATGDY